MAGESNPFYVQPPNVLQALMLGVQGFDSARKRQSEDDMMQGRREAAQALQTGQDVRPALAKLLGVGDVKGAAVIADFARNQQSANGVYGTPIYGTDPNTGETVLGAIGRQGGFQRLDTGGVKINPGIKLIETPQGVTPVDARSGRPIGSGTSMPGQDGQPQGYYPKNYKDTEAEKVVGRETGEKAAALGKAKMSLDNSVNNLDQLQIQANEVLQHPGLGRITGVAGMLPNVPGYPGADAQAKLDTLRAKVGFAALQAMRDASKTGGALGQVSDFENKQLQNSMVELQNAQSEKQIKTALRKIITQVDGMKDRLQKAYETDYAGLQRPSSNMQPGTQGGSPPMQGARQAPDGKWYVQKGGRWFEVRP